MKMLEKILVATDFSRSADDALKTAQTLAVAFGSRIILVHVIPEFPEMPVSLRTLKAEARKRLRKVKTQLKNDGVKTGDSVVAVGSSFDQIIQASELLDVNLIVVGSGKIEGNGWWLALTSERLVRRAAKPVLVVRSGITPVFERILCPVDYSDASARALTHAIHLARTFQAKLTVLMVTQTFAGLYASSAKLARHAQAKFHRSEEKQADAFFGQFDFTDVRWKKAVKEGNPGREILKFAKKGKANLLVMGSEGRTGIARMLIGSVAAKVLREMPCSVITVKAEDAIRLQLETEIADIEKQWECGQELLKKGFPNEALQQFNGCLRKNSFYVPALQGLADAQARMGHLEQAEMCAKTARHVRESVRQDRVAADVRSGNPLISKH